MKMTTTLAVIAALCTIAFVVPGTAGAQDMTPAALYAARACQTCHGEDGRTPLLPNYPIIAGQNAQYAAAQMRDIKSGARANGASATMKALMTLVSDEEIDILATYLAGLPR